MKTPEKFEKDAIRKFLNSVGAYHVVTHMGGFGAAGTSDILACIAGFFIAIEVKREGKEPTPRQWVRIQEVQKRGGLAVWGTAEKVIAEIREWANANGAHFRPLLTGVGVAHTKQLAQGPRSSVR